MPVISRRARRPAALLGGLAVVLGGAFATGAIGSEGAAPAAAAASTPSAPATSGASATGSPAVGHVFVINLEN